MPRRHLISYHFDSDEEDDDESEYDNEYNNEGYYEKDSGSDDSSSKSSHSSSSSSSSSAGRRDSPENKEGPTYSLSSRQRHQWTIFFGLIPLAMFLYVWDVTSEEQAFVRNPNGIQNKQNSIDDDFVLSSAFPQAPLIDAGDLAATNDPMEIQNHGIWIHVVDFHVPGATNGIGDWQIALAEVLTIAKYLNAVVVELGMSRAQLVSCEEGAVGLFDVYEEATLKAFYPKIASCIQYQTALNQLTPPETFPICMKRDDDDASTPGCDQVPSQYSDFGQTTSETLNEAVVFSRKHPDRLVHIQLHELSKNALINLKIPSPKYATLSDRILDRTIANQVRNQHLKFSKSLYEHWNSALAQYNDNHPSVPAVSFDHAVALQWNPAGKASTDSAKDMALVESALQVLPDTAFIVATTTENSGVTLEDFFNAEHPFRIRLEDLVRNPLRDEIGWVVLNLILAESVGGYVSCATQCASSSYKFCQACNVDGPSSLADEALRFRGVSTISSSSTYPCWPKKASETKSISKLDPKWQSSYKPMYSKKRGG